MSDGNTTLFEGNVRCSFQSPYHRHDEYRRSLDCALDTAFRRRFGFNELMPYSESSRDGAGRAGVRSRDGGLSRFECSH